MGSIVTVSSDSYYPYALHCALEFNDGMHMADVWTKRFQGKLLNL